MRDIKNASLVSQHWYLSSLDSSIMKKKVLVIQDSVLLKPNWGDLMYYHKPTRYQNISDILYNSTTDIMKSTLPYKSIKMSCNSQLSPLTHCLADMDFWKRMAKSLKFLEISQVNGGDWENIFEVLSHLQNLESLCLSISCFKDSSTIPRSQFENVICKKLTIIDLNLSMLDEKCDYLPKFLGMLPEIVHFKLTCYDRTSLEIKQHIIDYLNVGKNRIKTLILKTESQLVNFILIKIKGMHLQELLLGATITYMPLEMIYRFTNPNQLLRLSLHSESKMDQIMNIFPNLLELYVGSYMSKNVFSVSLNKAAKDRQSILENLELSIKAHGPGIYFSNRSFTNMRNLTRLSCEVRNYSDTDGTLQLIFKYLKMLKHIKIGVQDVTWLAATDYGFTGIREQIPIVGYSISNLTFLETLNFKSRLSRLGDLTLLHISKLKRLRSLEISCANVIKLVLHAFALLIVIYFLGF